MPANSARRPPREEIVSRMQIATLSVRSTPAPTPTPLPPAPAPQWVAALSKAVASPAAASPSRARPAARAAAVARNSARLTATRPIWDVAAARKSAFATDAGNATTSAGNASGAGTQGSGGATGGAPPCGYVTFSDPHGSHYDARTHGFWVDIRMSVHFADGSAQSMVLDYPWYYPSEAANPWSDRNLNDPRFPTRFQPPPSEKIADEPQLVKYVMEHSTPEGTTLLRDCPEAPPTPAKRRLLFRAR